MNKFVGYLVSFVLGAVALASYSYFSLQSESITVSDISHSAKILGLEFSDSEIDSLLPNVQEMRESFQQLREFEHPNSLSPSLVFLPKGNQIQTGQKTNFDTSPKWLPKTQLPANDHEIAYLTTAEQAFLIRNKKLTSVRLTQIYIDRIKMFSDTLENVITLMEKSALTKAEEADREIASGKYRGPLHGIPYGIKDLFSVAGTKTTWGAEPYKDQMVEETATIVTKLDDAGAVLVAKLTLGALAWGDVWYGGVTKNPWNLKQGSSGSSAGSASAVSSALVSFAIGTETLGSIVSPSTRCGVSGLRPSFGAVSRAGGMALSWSMDKAGPMARSIEDAALVFDVIRGSDVNDAATRDIDYKFEPVKDITKLKIGYAKSLFDRRYFNKSQDSLMLEVFKNAGVELIPVELPSVNAGLSNILSAEAAAAFDELTRSNRDDEMVRQIRNAWPNVFRAARFIPAVEYIQANRQRTQLTQEAENILSEFDVVLTPAFGGSTLFLTNLTGHPATVMPNGFNSNGSPTSFTIIAGLDKDANALAVADWYQKQTDWHKKHPNMFMSDSL